MRQFAIILSITLAVFATSCKNEVKEGVVEVVTPEEMQSLLEMEDIQLVDVRTPEERLEGYIENSQNIDYNSPTFDADILKLDKNKPVILYCKSGGRSSKCAEKLKEAGFVKIYDLKGGITQWEFEGFKIKTID